MPNTVFIDRHVHLDSRETMFAVLDELVGDDADKFRGSVSVWPEQNPPGPAKWSIELNDWSGNTVRAELGDHLVLVYGRLLRFTDTEFQAQQGS